MVWTHPCQGDRAQKILMGSHLPVIRRNRYLLFLTHTLLKVINPIPKKNIVEPIMFVVIYVKPISVNSLAISAGSTRDVVVCR